MRTPSLFAAVLLSVSSLYGAYTYDYSENPVISDSGRWSTNGSPTFSSTGVTFSGAAPGGSLISSVPISVESGGSQNDYEVNTALKIGNLATYIHFLRASSGTVEAGSGSYLSVELVVGRGLNTYLATLNVNQCINGTVTQLGSTSLTLRPYATLRSVVFGNELWVFVNNSWVWAGTTAVTAGNPGIGGYGMRSGSGFLGVSLGHHDTVAPAQVNAHPMPSSIFPGSVSLQWQGAVDDVNGIGMLGYYIVRNGEGVGFPLQAEFADATVQPSTTYTYQIYAEDYHGNYGPPTSVTVTTPPAGDVDPRRTGVNSTGTYWGGGGEQIDTLSGNLHFSVPLLAAQGRTGWTVPVNLIYDSQNWLQDSGTNWLSGVDTGYGFGWKLLIGSITPFYTAFWSPVDHYIYTDSTGAEYRLDQNNNGIWTASSQSAYVWFDPYLNILHFKDGSFWAMGSTSGGTEQDAGTLYPTLIEDSNGNQIQIAYDVGAGAAAPNTSGRIVSITDVRAPSGGTTYSFSYSIQQPSDPALQYSSLSSITNSIGTAETYEFQYTPISSVQPPFGADGSFAGLQFLNLTSVTTPIGSPWQFIYDTSGAGELNQATSPPGGYIRWVYGTTQYAGSRLLREVSSRYLAPDAAGSHEWAAYNFTHSDSANTGKILHSDTTLADASGVGAKTWTFFATGGTPAWEIGLTSQSIQSASPGGTVLSRVTNSWAQDAGGHPYIASTLTALDEASPGTVSTMTSQAVDQYGNITQQQVFDYGNLTTPVRTWTNTWLHTGNPTYDSEYIRNRLLSSTLTDNASPPHSVTLVANTYDQGSLAPVTGAILLDQVQLLYRGNITQTVTPGSTTNYTYDVTGHALTGADASGTGSTATYTSTTQFAAPSTTAPMAGTADVSNSHTVTQASGSQLATSLGYTSALNLSTSVMPNSATSSQNFDSSTGLLTSSVSVYGATSNYAYAFAPTGNVVTATTNSHWSKAYKDGLGRDIAAEKGFGTTTVSHTDTVYGPSPSSPMGSTVQASQPYGIGAGGAITASDGSSHIAWTSYTFDGAGRTLTSTTPDGSVTNYLYLGNTTKVTDPAGNWKRFTNDALGNLIKVEEPNPQYGAADNTSTNFVTNYSYDIEGHLTQVQTPRPTGTQTRTYSYDLPTARLLSVTNPENGTVGYSYYPSGRLLSKTDANGQMVVYSYDGYGRLAYIDRYHHTTDPYPDPCQSTTLSYDSNNNGLGRISNAVTGWVADDSYCGGWSVSEWYGYSPGGLVTSKGYEIDGAGYPDLPFWIEPYSFGPGYTLYSYDNEGNMTGYGAFAYTLDAMGRPTALTETGPGTVWVQNATYGPAGEMQSMQYRTNNGTYYTETRSYNNDTQLTALQTSATGLPGINFQYAYPANANTGRISQMTNVASGEQITYTYDALTRLIKAETSPSRWGQAFGYDGFGNLTSKSPTPAGPSTSMAVSVDPATNHLTTYGFSYDANGNMTSYPVTSGTQSLTYDIENRTGGQGNWYDLENQPLNRDGMWNQYGLRGERLASYAISLEPYTQQIDGIDYSYYVGVVTQTLRNIWFGNRLIQSNGQTVVLDRQGSVRANEAGETFEYFPYGEEITPTANGREKFATYTRESATGLDYADQRYYSSVYGRFTSSDPDHQTATAPADPNTPGSWNRYVYAGGDPINHVDPTGNDVITDLFDCFSEIAEAAFAGPAPCANPSLSGVSSFCGGASDQFNPLAAMACLQTIQFQSPDNQHVLQPPPMPSCSISLYERPTPTTSSPGWHTYLAASVDGQTETIEGGPVPGFAAVGGTLTGTTSPPNPPLSGYGSGDTTNPILSSNKEVGSPYSGSNACADIASVNSWVASYNSGSKVTYNFLGIAGYNSNSFTYTLDNQLGLLNFFGVPSGWVPGWGKLVPGL